MVGKLILTMVAKIMEMAKIWQRNKENINNKTNIRMIEYQKNCFMSLWDKGLHSTMQGKYYVSRIESMWVMQVEYSKYLISASIWVDFSKNVNNWIMWVIHIMQVYTS